MQPSRKIIRSLTATLLTCMFLVVFMMNSQASRDSSDSASPAREITFAVYLEGFTENPELADIAYVIMKAHVESGSPWQLHSTGIAGACQGWWESTESGMVDGPSFLLSAHDHYAATYGGYVEYPLQDGMMFYADCTVPVIDLSLIYFWNVDEIGDYGANQYPAQVELTELTSSMAVFSSTTVASNPTTWGRVKTLYR